MAKFEKLDDNALLSILENHQTVAVGFNDSDLSEERAQVIEYYRGEQPQPSHRGNSKYVSLDVFDVVESMKAGLLDTFCSDRGLCRFTPEGPEDVEMAEIATAYTDYQIFRRNDAHSIFADCFHDGLMARVGIIKYWWEEDVEEWEEEFEEFDEAALTVLGADPEVTSFQDIEYGANGLASGTVVKERRKGYFKYQTVPPEEFLIEAGATSIETAGFVDHRCKKTYSDLLKEGYKKSLLDKISLGHEDVEIDSSEELQARFDKIGSDSLSLGEVDHEQKQKMKVWVHENYIDLDIEGTGTTKLWKIFTAGEVVLDKQEVTEKPFLGFVPLPMSHTFHGENFALKVKDTQNAKTVLTRGVLDHTVITNNPRMKVVRGGVTNPQELTDNRVGGIVNVTRSDAVEPLQQSPLNPFVFEVLGLLDQDKEDRTSVSRLSKGLNKDAISKQNSQGMVQDLVTLSQQRQKVIARNFVEQVLKPLYLKAYELVLESQDAEDIIQVAGNWAPVNASQWRERKDVVVELALGYKEYEQEAAKYLQLYQIASGDPALAPGFGYKERRALVTRTAKLYGIKDADAFLMTPDQVQPPPPDPYKQAEMQIRSREVAVQERRQAMEEAKMQTEQQLKVAQLQAEMQEKASKHALESDKVDIQEAELAHKKAIDTAELEILRETDDRRGIVSPTG